MLPIVHKYQLNVAKYEGWKVHIKNKFSENAEVLLQLLSL